MKLIIFSHEQDYHSQSICWALNELNVESYIIPTVGDNLNEKFSFSINDSKLTIGNIIIEKDDVVWLRRPQPPKANKDVCNAGKKFVENELRESLTSEA